MESEATTSFKNCQHECVALRQQLHSKMANVNGSLWGDNFIQKWPTWTESEPTASFKNGQRERVTLRQQLHSKMANINGLLWCDNFIQKWPMWTGSEIKIHYVSRSLKVWPTWRGSETTWFKNGQCEQGLRRQLHSKMANVNGIWLLRQKFTT